ncbi:MAG: sulfite exporter TauE/SafE family protein [Thermoanaerobaculia bacterium]|nr:MAG: sulfite exporter TauE/SafE family protein [Thermoanaerobaculia bacterium]
MNALAGGGTILTFPTLLLLGESARVANATSTVALLPGAAASLAGYRREVAGHRRWLGTLFLPSLLGGAAGSLLLLATPEKIFARLAPWLVLFATALFAFQSWRAAHRPPDPASSPGDDRRRAVAWLAQFGVAVYGGYFGAGIGILMLVVLGYLGLSDIHAMNGLKNFFGICINAVAAAVFVAGGLVDWPVALVVLVGAVAGGWTGAHFGRWIGPQRARAAVVVIGTFVGMLLLVRGM